MERRYLTRKEVMELLNISYSHCDKLFKSEGFQKIGLGGKEIVSETDLYEYLDAHKGTRIPLNVARGR